MYKRVLLPLDGSKLAHQAIPHAVDIARSMGAGIVLLRVLDGSGPSALESLAMATDPATGAGLAASARADLRMAAERAEAEQELADAMQEVAQGGLDIVTEIAEGSAGETIVRLADELGCDLVVIASHGRSGLTRSVLGSVADHVVRHTPHAAVLVIAPDDAGE